ncbi:MAG TPA: ADP-ribose pyrophosphatase [Anaerolineaceae bacterium]|nr:ADP-ribose pyrophosphatase [Anaerolineaceae bacterium]
MKIDKITTIYTGRTYTVEEVGVILPNGKQKVYDRINHRDSVTILPLDADGNIWFVKQFRLGSTSELLELPAGVMEEGEEPIGCAKREIREEIGMAASQWKKLGSYYLAPGYATELNHAFLAQDLFSSPLDMDEDEFLHVEQFPIQTVLRMLHEDSIHDGKTLAALALFFQNSVMQMER